MDIFHYWDSVCFLGILNNEQDKAEICKQHLKCAEQGKMIIVTSAITLAEVVRVSGRNRLDSKNEELIHKFFQSDFIEVRDCSRKIAEEARKLLWKYEHLQYKDAIHAATAVHFKIKTLHTYDDDLLRMNGDLHIDESTNITICLPEQIISDDIFDE